jgi:hypothetical protein
LTVPSERFEAFSQELFDMVGTTASAEPVNLDTLLLQAAEWNLPSSMEGGFDSAAMESTSSMNLPASSMSAMNHEMPILDFFDVTSEDNGMQSTEWSSWNGPSWLDIFDVDNTTSTLQSQTQMPH